MNKNKIPLISIVIPVYNAAPYLVRCLDSVVEQTIENIEIIIVNDGSTDNSLEICEMYKEKDKRVVLINKQNGGLSDARNVGINMAKGQYIGFVDSDDWIRKNMFERLYAPFLENSNVDIAVCGYALVELVDKRVYKRKQICTINKEETYDSNIYKIVYSKDSDRALEVPVWNKLYRKKLFDNLKFEIGKINEDNLISLELYSKVKKIIHIPGYYYYYRFNDLGICRTKYSQKSLTILEAKRKANCIF
ncbi:glycosyltransferase family 2 protein [Eubacterium limosum]|uniref:glycosyltransferase family 2 protein n=1 Tax=Eubacterium limosum TaxID=1736 RepID=UPI00106391BD|nr:glycosyltransferase [Eubacterium limosum]